MGTRPRLCSSGCVHCQLDQLGFNIRISTFHFDPENAGEAKKKDQAEGLLIIRHWPTAVWYPQMLKLLIRRPILLPRGKRVLQLAHLDVAHPLHRRLQLLAVYLSGKLSTRKAFKAELAKLPVRSGGSPPRDSMLPTSLAETSSAPQGTPIPFVQLWHLC